MSILYFKMLLLVTMLIFYDTHALEAGDICVKDGVAGVCKNLSKCQGALDELRNGKSPQTCSFDKSDPIVCCLESTEAKTISRPPVATITKRSLTATNTEYITPEYTYVDTTDTEDGCEPLSPNKTAKKTGQKAWDKCIEYQMTLVYPCEKALGAGMTRKNHCNHNIDQLIVGGTDAAANEFPHMAFSSLNTRNNNKLARLGYGQDPNIEWVCGGALISDRFILTAGHCIASRDLGNVTFAYIGALARQDIKNGPNRYGIKSIIKHPNYLPPKKYNDIALLETDRQVPLNQFTVPACLYVGDDVDDERAQATGWGYGKSPSDVLQKVVLTKFSHEECFAEYQLTRLLREGVNKDTQMCYGDRTMSKDICQSGSGGPLQIKSKKIDCMYLIVGVTSFIKACGDVNVPWVYTRVSNYIPWIESIVWP